MAKLPTVRSRKLGARLRNRRRDHDLDQEKTAEAIGVSQASMSKIENGDTKLGLTRFNTLCELLDIDSTERDELNDLRLRAEEKGWWQAYSDILAAPVQTLIELEQEASAIRTYEGAIIPGLLQTRRYAEEIITASSSHVRVDEIDRLVELRVRRQERLRDPQFQLTAVVSEAAIRQHIGGREVLHQQLQHLASTIHQYNVMFQVVPFTADAHPALTDQFVIIQWPRADDPEAVYVDGQTSWTMHEGAGEIRRYTHAFAAVQNQALSPKDSLELINKVREELEDERR